jgi:hypothetical protein
MNNKSQNLHTIYTTQMQKQKEPTEMEFAADTDSDARGGWEQEI